MSSSPDSFESIPGTTLFDAQQSRKGYWLNQFCMSLMSAANRQRFLADPEAYLADWPMSPAQKEAVLARDLNRLIVEGGNIYFLVKLGATHGVSVQNMCASMTGLTAQAYRDMLLQGGRSIEGNRYVGEDGDAQPHKQPQGSGAGRF
ncbi:protocatechuate 4,5-dioxygenase subunit alpha [Ramlibacter sp. AW1]|uniref:Protocatechuate 4,5-dioxygenase subunit alpha n=1 Tax=Ramlibacter aurantiacus TaxID=2801330 RepID=A0A936ZMM4_9BURK|nr:protocatechuate 4,5-dioxygenase subunit alpha [Ramlibacter aurantiacus]MBL0420093.1 protocatechuate 4,5-dioxygenase subunit alpha [Ramlibacter aurantiacus]